MESNEQFVNPFAELEPHKETGLGKTGELVPFVESGSNQHKQIVGKSSEPETSEHAMKIGIFKHNGFIVVNFHQSISHITMTKKQAKEMARLLIRESL